MRQTTLNIETRWTKKIAVLFVLFAFTSDFALGASVLAPALLERFSAQNRVFISQNASLLGLSFSNTGEMLLAERHAASGALSVRPLKEETADKVITFLSRLPKDDPELGMALAMQSFLAPRIDPKTIDNNIFVTRDESGRLTLTPLGWTALLDVLTASDGGMLKAPTQKIQKRSGAVMVSKEGKTVSRVTGGLQAVRHSQSNADAAFDGARHPLGDFDWKNLGEASVSVGGLKGFSKKAAEMGYSYNKETGTVRVLVAADQFAAKDRFKVKDHEAVKGDIYRETGLDEQLFDAHGAKVVRVIDNIVVVDVPLPSAVKLGLALEQKGVESRPARVYKAAVSGAAAAVTSPAAALLGTQFLPIPTDALGAKKAASNIQPALVDAGVTIDVEGLGRAKMTGRGAYVGVIDSGVDINHEDFKDVQGRSRIQEYKDFTEEGLDDVVGHGTHVSGIVGGNGKASKGKFKGMAPEARFKVAKVFGSKGETDESVILAAMKWMKEGRKVDLINMSLGGPGAANKDPLSSLANQMIVKDDILIVAAAGNEGPFEGSVGSPGNSRYALTVGGVDKDGKPVFFSSRGPIRDENGNILYAKPDLVGVAGGVDFSAIEKEMLVGGEAPDRSPVAGLASAKGVPAKGKCVYAPGIAAPRSSSDPDINCALEGYPGYRYMSGTSQAAPMTAGFAADVIGYAKAHGAKTSAFELKALLMETAVDLKEEKEFQGAGLINGSRVARTVIDRVKRGIPIGNIAYALAMRMTSSDQWKLEKQTRYEMTPVGLLDKETGHILNTEKELMKALEEIRKPRPILMVGREEDSLLPV